ncbi:MAG: kynureninase [Proteobacteria bacterium]|nr:kynureninase [Pseudomonadota bacterium]
MDTPLISARTLDEADELAAFRNEFHLPIGPKGRPVAYFAGNSLGLQPKAAAERVEEELTDWRRLGVLGHHAARRPWVKYHEFLTEVGAQLTGSLPAEVVHMNSTTVNLHLMMASFYRPTSKRFRILMEKGSFPSDRYAVTSHLGWHGLTESAALLECAPRAGESVLRNEDILDVIARQGSEIALVLFSGVQYATGQVFDMPAITAAAHERGCIVGFDLAHAVGNIPLRMHDWGPDFAVWCSYKYLNGGPGAVAGCYVHERHARDFARPRLGGWWGHDKDSRFLMDAQFVPMPGAEGWQLSNPPVLGLAPLLAAYELFERATVARLRAKSIRLTGFLEGLLTREVAHAVEVVTPRDPQQRGCQLSLRVKEGRQRGRETFERLEAAGVICDWREPDIIRAAPVPLYNNYSDVCELVKNLAAILA